jgi:primary-amine oxidase
MEAKRNMNFNSGRIWKICSSEKLNRMGYPTAWKIVPGANFSPMVHENSDLFKKAGFLRYHIWATEYDPNEIHVSGNYPNQRGHDDGLNVWVNKKDEIAKKNKKEGHDIVDKDLVVWYKMAVHHIFRPEEWPVMPCERISFHLKPFGFFYINPMIMMPSECKKSSFLAVNPKL